MSDAASTSLGVKLEALYATLPSEEQQIVDFLLTQAAEHIAAKGEEVGGYGADFVSAPGGTQDRMKRVLFGAAGVTGSMATPGVVDWLVASARDANLFT